MDVHNHREKMGQYAIEVNKLAMEMMGAITESLGIGPTYLRDKMEDGMQVMAINCYPPCPQPDLSLGLPRATFRLQLLQHCRTRLPRA